MKPPDLRHWTVQTLYQQLRNRSFAIPKLQRNFVWDSRRAAKFLDSMYHQMPIGSVFLWEMDRKSAHLIRQSARILPPYDDRNSKIWFVIDGQQRLSVLYQAFEAEQQENDAGKEIDFGRLCFVVNPDSDAEESADRIVYRKPRGREFIPVRDILRPDWKRLMPTRAQSFLRKVKLCRERLLKYVVPLVVVRSATLEEIGEVFVRVNSQGMRITSADRAIALMGKLDVSDMARELRQTLREQEFGTADIQPILMGFNLVTEKLDLDGDPPKLDVMARRWARAVERNPQVRNQFKKQWDRFKKAFLAATQYLHDRFPVHDASYLPSANMLSILAVFFYHHRGQPTTQQAKEIRKWFWATGVGVRYSGAGYHRNIVSDANMFRRLAQSGRARFVFEERLDPLEIQSEQYNAGSARTRAFFCLLAKQNPCYLDDGQPINFNGKVINPASAKHRHHIFPRAQLSALFSPRAYNSLSNICFLVSADNEGIGKRLPRTYLAECRDNGRKHFRALVNSHLIPAANGCGVWEHNLRRAFKQFRAERLKLICNAFEKEAGMKLFRWERSGV
jgi:hypothetical protein